MMREEVFEEKHDYPWWDNGGDYRYKNSQATFHYVGDKLEDEFERKERG